MEQGLQVRATMLECKATLRQANTQTNKQTSNQTIESNANDFLPVLQFALLLSLSHSLSKVLVYDFTDRASPRRAVSGQVKAKEHLKEELCAKQT